MSENKNLKISEIECLNREETEKIAVKIIRGEFFDNREECIRLSWAFFLDFHNSSDVLEKIDPEDFKRRKISKSKHERHSRNIMINNKSRNKNYIANCFKFWIRTNFFEVKSIKGTSKYQKKKTVYRFGLEPFFVYCKNELNISFTPKEKNILEYLLYDIEIRKLIFRKYGEKDFITALLYYYFDNCYLRFLQEKAGELKE